jgi:hypothetical protein
VRVILILLLTTFSACQNFPSVEPQERCVLSLEFNKCRCHLYDLMNDRRISDSYDEDATYCERLVGFRPEAWQNIKIWLGEIKIWRESRNRSK